MREHGENDNDGTIPWNDVVVFVMCYVWGGFRDISTPLDHEQVEEIRGCEGTIGEQAFSPSGLSPRVSASTMDEHDFKAFRVIYDHETARIPPPTEQLYNELALRGWNDYRREMSVHVGHDLPNWDDLPDHLKMVWISVAHGQHGVIAWRGGGTVEMIEDDAE